MGIKNNWREVIAEHAIQSKADVLWASDVSPRESVNQVKLVTDAIRESTKQLTKRICDV